LYYINDKHSRRAIMLYVIPDDFGINADTPPQPVKLTPEQIAIIPQLIEHGQFLQLFSTLPNKRLAARLEDYMGDLPPLSEEAALLEAIYDRLVSLEFPNMIINENNP
jgi:hypothetical protein